MSEFRLLDFNFYNTNSTATNVSSDEDSEDSGEEQYKGAYVDSSEFKIQMFGINEKGETASITVEKYKPFFYIQVGDDWTEQEVSSLRNELKSIVLKKYYSKSIHNMYLIQRSKLYGFDAGKQYNFVCIEFHSIKGFNKVKSAFQVDEESEPKMLYYQTMGNEKIYLYESNIPPLLRYFHIQEISPSGWIKINSKAKNIKHNKKTTCKYEYVITSSDIESLAEKETIVPYKICSFDIEASSSHGDFPLPQKTYKKLATNLMEYIYANDLHNSDEDELSSELECVIFSAFDLCDDPLKEIERVYPKRPVKTSEKLDILFENWITMNVNNKKNKKQYDSIVNYLQKMEKDVDEYSEYPQYKRGSTVKNKKYTVLTLIYDNDVPFDEKVELLDRSLCYIFPDLKGDEVTFVGSTFWKYGEKKPYLNHCGVVNGCSTYTDDRDVVIDTHHSEEQLLLSWTELIQREDPDIIIGYNIFGFDYEFMFRRSLETGCFAKFTSLSRNLKEKCYTKTDDGYKIEESKIVIASGEHELKYIKMCGRVQIDLYNYFRRDFNLSSYKLDHVAGEFIGDSVKSYETTDTTTMIKTKNMTGIEPGTFIHFEESSHSTDYYKDGAKFEIIDVNKEDGNFIINTVENFDMKKSVRWCIAKDDVTPQDIFRLTNGSDDDRSIIAKYCIQDCNLVHHLLNKIDVITGFIEMSKICSVPISFLVLRGQGIKLTSFIAQKCREKNTLMPVIEKNVNDDGYEGAIVLEPKCNLYLDDPVACVDYSSLYPSSMISENLCHTSKVWTKEYNLKNELICEKGDVTYDNLEGYKYVDVTYDTFRYVRTTEKSAAQKVRKGHKICRFAQYPEGKAILPSVLEQLLASRKATKKLMGKETDPFMKNILDKRQLSIKLTANSLYGQCGAKTSTFYEKDVAASTTATGRKLLTYAKRVIEEVYGDTECDTANFGKIRTKAEYVYGDTDSVFFKFNPETLDGVPIKGKDSLEITIELAQKAGELATGFLKKPHDLEYEKTFMPFCLLSKKRYVGMLYELDPNKCKQKSMGIVLKRRDNAPIVKDVYGGIIDILMEEGNIEKAVGFLNSCLQNMLDGNIPIEKLIITKSLRSFYKNPKQIAHKVLADRIAKRDPGNKPSPGDRIPFAYIQTKAKNALQGEKIETPSYINENNLKVDYSFYVTNQIMKPIQQLFALVLEQLPLIRNNPVYLKQLRMELKNATKNLEEHKVAKKIEDVRNKKIKEILFDKYLVEINNKKKNLVSIDKFFTRK